MCDKRSHAKCARTFGLHLLIFPLVAILAAAAGETSAWGCSVERYDLFKKLPDGSPYWVGCAQGLDEATRRISELMQSDPDTQYLIRDSITGENQAFPKSNISKVGQI